MVAFEIIWVYVARFNLKIQSNIVFFSYFIESRIFVRNLPSSSWESSTRFVVRFQLGPTLHKK